MRTRLLGLFAIPLLGYPFMALSLLLADARGGERLLSLYLRHEQRFLWDTFWSDYVAALPVMYTVVGAGVGTFLLLRRLRPDMPLSVLVLLLAGLGWAAATWLTSSWIGATHAALVVAATALGVLAAIAMRGLLRPQPGGIPA